MFYPLKTICLTMEICLESACEYAVYSVKLKKIHKRDQKQACTRSFSGTTALAPFYDQFEKESGAALSKTIQSFGSVLCNGSSGFRCKPRRVFNPDLYCNSKHCDN